MEQIYHILVLALVLSGCVSTSGIEEGVIYKTKIFVGYSLKVSQSEDFTHILTSEGYFRIKERDIEISDSTWCYIRLLPCRHDMHPDIAEQMCRKYFTWIGTDKEYRIDNKIKLKKSQVIYR